MSKSSFFWKKFSKYVSFGLSILLLLFTITLSQSDLFSSKINLAKAQYTVTDSISYDNGGYTLDNTTPYSVDVPAVSGNNEGYSVVDSTPYGSGYTVADSQPYTDSFPSTGDYTVASSTPYDQVPPNYSGGYTIADSQPYPDSSIDGGGYSIASSIPYPPIAAPASTPTCGYNCYPTLSYPNPDPIIYQNPAPMTTASNPVYPGSTGYSYAPYYYNAPTTYTDNSRYSYSSTVDSHNRSSVDSHDRVDSHAYQNANIGSFNDSHEGQFAQSGFNTTDSHDVSLSQSGGSGGATGRQSVSYTQTTTSPAFRGISYAQTGSGINTTGIEYRQFPLSGSTNTTSYRISQTSAGSPREAGGSGSTGTTSSCPAGQASSQDDQGNITCTQNKTVSQVAQPKVVYTAGDVVTELPKTGLPAAALLLSGLLPVGIKLRRLNKLSVEKSANSIWEQRQLSI